MKKIAAAGVLTIGLGLTACGGAAQAEPVPTVTTTIKESVPVVPKACMDALEGLSVLLVEQAGVADDWRVLGTEFLQHLADDTVMDSDAAIEQIEGIHADQEDIMTAAEEATALKKECEDS